MKVCNLEKREAVKLIQKEQRNSKFDSLSIFLFILVLVKTNNLDFKFLIQKLFWYNKSIILKK
jgi:hypothetical protein